MEKHFPSYLNLLENGELAKKAGQLNQILEECTLCPWECRVNRNAGKLGHCQTGQEARVYSYMPHHGEERPLSGQNGSGTIFFSGCNLHCVFCQNADISQENYGLTTTAEKLAKMMLTLQDLGCHNINLVSPTHVIPQIVQALLKAARGGLHLPLVYNSGGYDSLQTLSLLDGIIDIYMPDMKYFNPDTALRLSGIQEYPKINRMAVVEMHRQVGDLHIDPTGIARRGLMIRHLVLPNNLADTRKICHFISKSVSKNAYLNIMAQYRPEYKAQKFPEINRRITQQEFENAIDSAQAVGLQRLDSLPS